jgi:hypothetical protein
MTDLLTIDSVWLVLKMMFVVAFLLYFMFAGVVITQVNSMTKALNGAIDLPLRLIAWIHLFVAGGALLLAIMIL